MMGFPANPDASTSSPVLFPLRQSAGFHMITDVSLQVMPRR